MIFQNNFLINRLKTIFPPASHTNQTMLFCEFGIFRRRNFEFEHSVLGYVDTKIQRKTTFRLERESVPVAVSARARKSVSIAFNSNHQQAIFRAEATLNSNRDGLRSSLLC